MKSPLHARAIFRRSAIRLRSTIHASLSLSLSLSAAAIFPLFLFLPPPPNPAPSPNFRGNLIFRKNAPPSIITHRAISRARSPHFLLLDRPRRRRRRRLFQLLASPRSSSPLSCFSANNFAHSEVRAAPPVVRHSTIFLEEYVTRRFSGDINRRLLDPTEISSSCRYYLIWICRSPYDADELRL